jgi:hypothetical protein
VQKFTGRVNRRERHELAFFINQSSPCAWAVSNNSAPTKVSGAEHLPVSHPLSPLFAEPNGGHGWQETLERYPTLGHCHARLLHALELDGLTDGEFTTAGPSQRLKASPCAHEITKRMGKRPHVKASRAGDVDAR